MKIYTLSLSSVLGVLGFTSGMITPVQSQECPISPDGVRAVTCAQIYNATPSRVQLSGAVGEMTIDTDPQTVTRTGPFTAVAASPKNSLYPNNTLETATYAKAQLQFNDGTLVWLKPDTQVTLSAGNNCASQNDRLLTPSIGETQVIANQRLCLLSGSILVITPINNRIDKSNLSVITDEALIWKPASIYLVTRHPQQKRSEVFVFSGDQTARVFSNSNERSICGINPNRGVNAQAATATTSQSACDSRLRGGEYMTITSQGTSAAKPFDLPAWVATDSFFAPLRNNTTLQELGSVAVAQAAEVQTPTSMNTIQAIQPSLVQTVGFQRSVECPIGTFGDTPLGVAQLPNPQFNPVIPQPAIVPQPFVAPPQIPIRGLW